MDYDCHQAKRLLYARRSLLHQDSVFCSCFSFSSNAEFTYQEINQILAEIVDTDGPLGVIKSLLSLGADVNFNLRPGRSTGIWGRITQQRLAGVRSDVLLRATTRCQPETIRAIAAVADNQNIEVVFRQAILRKDYAALQALLSHDGQASPSPASLDSALGKAFEIVGGPYERLGQDIIERCLAAGSSGPQTDLVMSEGLSKALQNRPDHLSNPSKVARSTADSDTFQLVEAVRARNINHLLRLLKFPPLPRCLTAALLEAIKTKDHQLRYEIIRLFVGHGATDSCTAQPLVDLVQEMVSEPTPPPSDDDTDKRLLLFLLDQGMADLDYNNGEALQLAVKAARFDIVQEIVARQPSSDSLGFALPWAMQLSDRRSKRYMVTLLLRYHINEEAVCRALIDAVREGSDNGPKNLIRILLTRASVNYNNGEVFVYAIRQNRLDVLQLLLDQGTSYKTLFTAVREALIASTSQRRVIFGMLLRHLEVDHLNEALKHLVLEDNADLCLIGVVLQAGAEATFDNGVCIKNAAYRLDRNALRILTEHCGYNESIFAQALAVVLNRGREWISFEHIEVLRLLLRCGASAQVEVISRAMTEVVHHLAGQSDHADLADTLIEILCSAGADLGYQAGRAVSIARERQDSLILSSLLRYAKTPTANVQVAESPVSVGNAAEQPESYYRSAEEKCHDDKAPSSESKGPPARLLMSSAAQECKPPRPVVSRPTKSLVRIRPYGAPYFTQTLTCVDEKSCEAGFSVEPRIAFDMEKIPVVSVHEVEAPITPPLLPLRRFGSAPTGNFPKYGPAQVKAEDQSHPMSSIWRKAVHYGLAWWSDMAVHEDDQKIAETEVMEILQGNAETRRKIGRPEMTEVKTKRGQVIGHVDLSELRRWQRQNSL